LKDIHKLITRFRKAIDAAKESKEFEDDSVFRRFPKGCCGDASFLLAEYLLENGIESLYVCGTRSFDKTNEGTQTHAWLIAGGLVADITGDQFSDREEYYNFNILDYYGLDDAFHRLFEVYGRDIQIFTGKKSYDLVCSSRLLNLYNKIKKYLI